jgi:hypothetical protein
VLAHGIGVGFGATAEEELVDQLALITLELMALGEELRCAAATAGRERRMDKKRTKGRMEVAPWIGKIRCMF